MPFSPKTSEDVAIIFKTLKKLLKPPHARRNPIGFKIPSKKELIKVGLYRSRPTYTPQSISDQSLYHFL